MVEFLDRLGDDWGTAFGQFRLILILDQFEELFTRFVDQKFRDEIAQDPNLPDWNRRHVYFAALGKVLLRRRQTAQGRRVLAARRCPS